jgi:hypothetical protein
MCLPFTKMKISILLVKVMPEVLEEENYLTFLGKYLIQHS